MKLNVFGRIVEVERHNQQWLVFYCGSEGKKRPAHDIKVPAAFKLEEIPEYIADLCHEWATPKNNEIIVISR